MKLIDNFLRVKNKIKRNPQNSHVVEAGMEVEIEEGLRFWPTWPAHQRTGKKGKGEVLRLIS